MKIKNVRVSNLGRVCDRKGHKYWPSCNSGGYPQIGIQKGKRCGGTRCLAVHRLVHVLFNDPLLIGHSPTMCTVDHLDRDKLNAKPENLIWASQEMQAANRSAPIAYKKTNQVMKRVCLTRGEEQRHFDRILDAADFLRAFVNKRWPQDYMRDGARLGGWLVTFAEDDDLPGEEWRRVRSSWVSSIGRYSIDMKTKYFPSCRNGYPVVCINRRRVQLSHLILEAFDRQANADETADHIDRNPSNNCISNLRWASKTVQSQNRSASRVKPTKRSIKARIHPSDADWTVFKDGDAAIEALGVGRDQMYKSADPTKSAVVARSSTGINYKFEWVPDPDLPAEVWKDVVVADWCEGGKYGHL